MTAVVTIVGYAMRESLRRRVFLVVLALTLAFVALYGLGAHFAFRDIGGFVGANPEVIEPRAFVGATIFGLAMFAILFLGAVLAVFLTLGVVRGDTDNGLLQPLVVRPIGRGTMLASRLTGAAAVAAAYVIAVYLVAVLITYKAGSWTPDHLLLPALALALGVAIIAALSLLASVFMASTAQGIAIFMLFGAGLTAGLLGQIGRALDSDTLRSIADVTAWALPFEALYQGGLHSLISDTSGLTGAILQLGPFGGAEAGGIGLVAWSLAYLAAVTGIAVLAFGRRDL